MTELLVRRCRISENRPEDDIRIVSGSIAEIGPNLVVTPSSAVIDVEGRIAIPGLINAHCHLDKTLWGEPWVDRSPSSDVSAMIRSERANRQKLGLPNRGAMLRIAEAMAESGTTFVRTHTDVDPDVGLEGVEAVLELAERMSGRLSIEQVAFPQSGLTGSSRTRELITEAARLGVEAIGGLDPAGIDDNPVEHLDFVFERADRFGTRIDVHLHDGGTLGQWQLKLIADRTRALSLQGRVAVSHAFALGDAPRETQLRLANLAADSGVAFVTCAGFNDPVPPVRLLADVDVPLGLGTDGIHDQWSPFGGPDMLERVAQLAARCSLKSDDDLKVALRTATVDAARALGIPLRSLAVGALADIVIADCFHLSHAVVTHAPRFLVVKGGAVVRSHGTPVSEVAHVD